MLTPYGRNATAVIGCTAVLALGLWLIEAAMTLSGVLNALFFIAFGFGSYFLFSGKILLRVALLLVIPVLAALALEMLGFGDPAYPFIGVIFALPVSGIFLLAGLLAALAQRAYRKKLIANAS